MIDVVLVSCLSFDNAKIAEPLGVCYLAAVLREKGHSVKIIDPSIEGWSVEETIYKIKEISCKILGLSIIRDANCENAEKIVDALIESKYKSLIFMGGHGPSISIYSNSHFYDQIGKKIAGFMIGEGEISICNLVECIKNHKDWRALDGIAYWKDNKFVINNTVDKICDLDTIPFMARDILGEYVKKYGNSIEASILSSRGCAFSSCTYCSVGMFEKLQRGNRSRYRSVKNIVLEIKMVYEKYGVSTFNFEDDNFFMYGEEGKARLRDFCAEIKKLNFKIQYTFYCRADLVDYELFRELKETGLKGIFLGIESFSDETLKFYNKGLKQRHMLQALEILKRLDFSPEPGSKYRIHVGFILWNPLINCEDLKEAYKYIKMYRMPPKLFTRVLSVYPGCAISEIIDNFNLSEKNERGWKYKYEYMEDVEKDICNYINLVNGYRDRIRLIEKAKNQIAGASGLEIEELSRIRKHLDCLCYDFVEGYVSTLCEELEKSNDFENIQKYVLKKNTEIEEYVNGGIEELLLNGFRQLSVNETQNDLFRK